MVALAASARSSITSKLRQVELFALANNLGWRLVKLAAPGTMDQRQLDPGCDQPAHFVLKRNN